MKAHAIIGANWGDEGKGLMTDYICSAIGADVVVRFNGGAQAGHTVTRPDGQRHVFHHFSSGSFLSIPTFLSEFFIVNPILFAEEQIQLPEAVVYVHPDAVVTTPMDMLINQATARKRKFESCGVGIHETMRRSQNTRYLLTVRNMANRDLYQRIRKEYTPQRSKELGLDLTIEPYWDEVYFHKVACFSQSVHINDSPMRYSAKIVFEGAQGLMLDQNSSDFPHVSHSNTGMANVKRICERLHVHDIRATYVSRSYFTRHGIGPLPGEQEVPDFVQDETNVNNQFQGPLRYAPLNIKSLVNRIHKDANGTPYNLAITCMDQKPMSATGILPVKYQSFGPMREDVKTL